MGPVIFLTREVTQVKAYFLYTVNGLFFISNEKYFLFTFHGEAIIKLIVSIINVNEEP